MRKYAGTEVFSDPPSYGLASLIALKDLVKLMQSVEDSQKAAEPFMNKYQGDVEKYNARKKEILKAHACEYGQLSQAFQPTNCAYTPATKAKAK